MTEKMKLITETYYNDLLDLTQRLSLDGSGEIDDQDYIALTYVLEAIEEAKEIQKRLDEQRNISSYARKIAAFVYATAVLEQDENNWIVYQSEIDERFEELPEGWADDEDFIGEIELALNEYPGLENNEFFVERDDNNELYFDLCLWTDYIASDYNAE